MLALHILRSRLIGLKSEYHSAIQNGKTFEEAKKIYVEMRHLEKMIAHRMALIEKSRRPG